MGGGSGRRYQRGGGAVSATAFLSGSGGAAELSPSVGGGNSGSMSAASVSSHQLEPGTAFTSLVSYLRSLQQRVNMTG